MNDLVPTSRKGNSKQIKTPKLFVITILVDTTLEEEEIIEMTDSFMQQFPSNDWSKNIMYADREILNRNRRLNKL